VTHVRAHPRLAHDRIDVVAHAVGFVVGVEPPELPGWWRPQGLQVGYVPGIHARPVVFLANHPNQPVCGVFQQIRNDPAGAARRCQDARWPSAECPSGPLLDQPSFDATRPAVSA
jgi:hypothetical protein